MLCPVCGGARFQVAVPRVIIEREIHKRRRFVESRLRRPVTPAEAKDLTDFMHDDPAPLLESCAATCCYEPKTRPARLLITKKT